MVEHECKRDGAVPLDDASTTEVTLQDCRFTPIVVNQQDATFTLHTLHTAYQMCVDRYGYLIHLYYGPRTEGTMNYVLNFCDRGQASQPERVNDRTYSLDSLPQEFSFQGMGDLRNPMFVVREATTGAYGCDLQYRGYEVIDGKYGLPGLPAVYSDDAKDMAQTLKVILHDERLDMDVELLYGVMPTYDVITRAVRVVNKGGATIEVKRLHTASIDFMHGDFDVMTFFGRHGMERMPTRARIEHGSFSIMSRRGESSHQYNPFMIVCDYDATESAGQAWSMSFVYSGNFYAAVEKDQFDQVRMQMGLNDELFSYPVAPGEAFVGPEVIMTYSNEGLGLLSQNLHRVIRQRVCRGYWRDRVRPVLINSWEASYFDFTGDSLVELAKKAKECGIELLVMDDGWFGHRDDDMSSLGDWYPNKKKLGGTVAELAKRVNDVGLEFGIWYEPEMISEDSDLYRAHPDWALTVPGKPKVLGRHQLVLDMSRKEVRDNIFQQMCGVLDDANVAYLKWDCNRSLIDIYSRDTSDQGRVLYDYVLGLYDLLERVHERYPEMLIEGCAGGGGRFDAGMLYYTPQIWTSDTTDAINRLTIQAGTSFGYPTSTMGCHVSEVPNAITRRSTPLFTRGTVAMMGGGFGYELDITKLPDEEIDLIKQQVGAYHETAELVMNGRFYRLVPPETNRLSAWEFVADDGSEALVSAVIIDVHGYGVASYVVPRGLTPDSSYVCKETGVIYPSNALMSVGFPLAPIVVPYESYQFHFKRVEA
ncbi:alpha-galactosidase [Collinsella sp. An2]|uniref:alpha-galactosidase n=1 Tax=Collinsella sp. An2 TaxID=1965585 RepID=UPI000B3677E1|nr:alpha-galactosidase [Collinsella sp. An2]OUP10102.1 alpha-galactosidase [Collinsella sp. An2]